MGKPEEDGAPVTAPCDVADEVARLRRTFGSGRTRSLPWRREQLEGLLRLLDEREPELAVAIEQDLGRNAIGSFMGDIAPVRSEIRHTLKNLEKWARPRKVRVPVTQQPGVAREIPEPKGTVLVIGAWNFPILLTLHPLVSAIAAGNTVLLKPSELSPHVAAALATLLPLYLDPSAVAVVTGGVDVSTQVLAERFDHIFFTGSTRVGQVVLEAAAKHLTPVTLELGGKSPVIVTADADLDVAARRIAWGKCVNNGQACIAPDYVLVEDSVRPQFVERLLTRLQESAKAEPTRMVNEAHFDRVVGLLDGHGGDVVGGTHDRATLKIAGTVVTDPDPDSPVMQEEIFGPVLPVMSVPSLADAVAFVNDRPKPLALYVFSNSGRSVDTVVSSTSSGSVGVNQVLYQMLVPELPFGGVGESGMGSYHGRKGFDTFSHLKAVLHKPTVIDLALTYPPYGPIASRILRRVMG
ncbi:aldehyde dehydrogenase family protein [Rhodococcus qingshengii]|uniref:aldehyde dehydrogenase family protein n=1 Tax=Rhodococcus qingshengii TaxID=334542 RepID=UPI0036DDA320